VNPTLRHFAEALAVMPRRRDLPEGLASLARRNALSVRHESFRVDAERLLAAIELILHTDVSVGPGSSVVVTPGPAQHKIEPGVTTPTRLDEQQFLRSLDNDEYRQALCGLFDVAKAVGLVFEWGSMGSSIRLYTPDHEEPLTVAWLFPDRAGWSGLRHLTLGYDRGSATTTPSIRDALAEYVNAVRLVPGAMRAKARSLHAYTFAPEAVCAQRDQLERLLRGLSTKAREGRVRRASIPQRLVDHQLFKKGQPLRIVVPAGVGEDRQTIAAWLQQEPTRPAVTWRQDPYQPVIWAGDGRPYNLSSLIRHIVEQATGQPPQTQVWGPNWYRDDSDQTLAKLAEQLP
jgi:hypothetical protein